MAIRWRFVDVDTAERAEWLVQSVTEWCSRIGEADWDESTVALSSRALEAMADVPDNIDGHFDGTHVWIGGTPYVVVFEPTPKVAES